MMMDYCKIINQLNSILEIVNPPPALRDDKISYRRKKVRKLILAGNTQQNIANELNYSLSTIEKDVRKLRKGILPPQRIINL